METDTKIQAREDSEQKKIDQLTYRWRNSNQGWPSPFLVVGFH